MVNKFKGSCSYCGGTVPARGGVCFKAGARFAVAHLACKDSGAPAVTTVYFPSSGVTLTQNRRGRCEDAPCCGCCTY